MKTPLKSRNSPHLEFKTLEHGLEDENETPTAFSTPPHVFCEIHHMQPARLRGGVEHSDVVDLIASEPVGWSKHSCTILGIPSFER